MFNINQPIFNSYGDELDEELVGEYIEEVISNFAESPEARPIIEQFGSVGWSGVFLQYAFNHLGIGLPRLTASDASQVVFSIFPRKVSTEPESAAAIVAELRAFFTFLGREYGLPNAKKIVAIFSSDAERRLRAELADPSNYGMAKSIFMMGQKSGFDMSTQAGLNAFMLAYNQSILSKRVPAPPPPAPPTYSSESSSPAPANRAERRFQRKLERLERKRNR